MDRLSKATVKTVSRSHRADCRPSLRYRNPMMAIGRVTSVRMDGWLRRSNSGFRLGTGQDAGDKLSVEFPGDAAMPRTRVPEKALSAAPRGIAHPTIPVSQLAGPAKALT